MNRRTFNRLAASTAVGIWAGTAEAKADVGYSRVAPEEWNLWRCGPISFPNSIHPLVPELAADGVIMFGNLGADLVIVTPDRIESSEDGRELRAMVRLIRAKLPNALMVPAGSLLPKHRESHLLVVGTHDANSFAHSIQVESAAGFVNDMPQHGYHLRTLPSLYRAGRSIILALGSDPAGAWNVAAILAYSIHPENRRLTELHPWPFQLPSTSYWASFEAIYQGNRQASTLLPVPSPAPVPPRIPFGMRIWGSPMPTLESFQRLIQALKPLGINTIAIQGGGWPDLPNAPELYRSAIDMAWREGIFTIIYVGNDMLAHKPAPLTPNHKALVLAIKDHPGLLEWHLYNQLSANLTEDQHLMVQKQMHWLRSVSSKPVGVEVVWGHDIATIPSDKIRLIQDLKSWGMTVVANDDAPIGGWSRKHDVSIWEPRLLDLRQFGLPAQAVLQAHIPFVDPTIPSAAQVRSQFWWAVAGGATAYLFETAYLFTDLSMRGILSWDLRPLPDGRYDEIRRLAGIARQMEPMLRDTEPQSGDLAEALGLALDSDDRVAMRLRRSKTGEIYLLLINKSTEAVAQSTILMKKETFTSHELAPGGSIRKAAPNRLAVELAPGDGACFQLT